jgi:hypothetical protein
MILYFSVANNKNQGGLKCFDCEGYGTEASPIMCFSDDKMSFYIHVNCFNQRYKQIADQMKDNSWNYSLRVERS